jgi:hypothetical protein
MRLLLIAGMPDWYTNLLVIVYKDTSIVLTWYTNTKLSTVYQDFLFIQIRQKSGTFWWFLESKKKQGLPEPFRSIQTYFDRHNYIEDEHRIWRGHRQGGGKSMYRNSDWKHVGRQEGHKQGTSVEPYMFKRGINMSSRNKVMKRREEGSNMT